MRYVETFEEVRVNAVSRIGLREVRLRITGLDPHLSHEGRYVAPVDIIAKFYEFIAYPSASVEWYLQMNLVDQSHEFEITGTRSLRYIVDARTGNIQKL